MPRDQGFIKAANVNLLSKKMTRGWGILVHCKDGSSNWINMEDLMDSNPVELSEYAVTNRLEEGPSFKLWVKDVLKKQ